VRTLTRSRRPPRHAAQIGEEDIEALYHYAKFQFECGNYSGAAEFLRYYRSLCSSAERSVSALWGKFAADILMQDWDEAAEDMTRLKEIIDAKMGANPLGALTQRTWLAHWSLFVFFNHENGRNAIIDLFFQDRYLSAIQTHARHLLRYLAAAVVVNKRRRNMLKDLVRVLQQESYAYSDPITQFLECLFVKYDFEGAQARLAECDALLRTDFFLVGCREEFMERARSFIFETYCRIHQCIDVRALSARLAMPQEEAERWVVNLIRTERLAAKIDAKAGTVVMGAATASVYESIIDRTKQLSFRTFQMANALLAAPPVGGA
jgi:translation initiation factor 3 subunit E